jgi:hypothetical protein
VVATADERHEAVVGLEPEQRRAPMEPGHAGMLEG